MEKPLQFTLHFILCYYVVLGSFNCFAQQHEFSWVLNLNASGSGIQHVTPQCVVTDSLNYIYVCGYFEGNADFGQNPNYQNISSFEESSSLFVQKLDTNGRVIWLKTILGDASVLPRSMCLNKSGDVIITGSFWGNTDFDSGNNVVSLSPTGINNLSGDSDCFLLKLDSLGDFQWVRSVGYFGSDSGWGIDTDSQDNIFITGNEGSQPFVSMFDAMGNPIWHYSINTLGTVNYGTEIAIDSFDNVYVTGYFYDNAFFTDGSQLISNGLFDIFLLKMNTSGDLIWSKNIGGSGSDYKSSMTLDSEGNIILTGEYGGTVDFDTDIGITELTSEGSHDIFLTKYNPNGELVWARSYGGLSSDLPRGVSVDSENGIYLTGLFNSSVNFGSSSSPMYQTSSNQYKDVFILKVDSSGESIWSKSIGTILNDNVYSISVDRSSNVYCVGNVITTIDFDPGIGEHIVSHDGSSENGFILRLGWPADHVEWKKWPFNVILYPNPTQGNFTVFQSDEGHLEIEIFNQLGELVKSEVGSGYFTPIDIGAFSYGVYNVVVNSSSQRFVGKVVKVK